MKSIEKVSVVQLAETEIKKYILSEQVKIGDKLPSEKKFCEELGIARGSVREALRLLQAKGYLEISHGKGAVVLRKEEITQEEMAVWFQDNEVELKDVIEVRMAIEPIAVRLAIDRYTPKELEQLKDIHRRAVDAACSHSILEMGVLDERFHTAIIECSHNKLLISINKEIVKTLKQFRKNTFQIEGNIENCIPYHTAILMAIEEKDVERAQQKLLEHLECVASDLEMSKLKTWHKNEDSLEANE
ncbi:MAG: FadR/GntR family transcriptional regulator [Lachnospiraceae bacterium]|uniref:FadR/GntR family transcriptional regulator n=1 Tax=Parablautia sp. Marseille-Q6255 TaxID=3039593 RepID=UPI0024BC5EF4|nr:FadR/GntR family transcriptional regulator [Parablautia sp. Marseille-Q6255]